MTVIKPSMSSLYGDGPKPVILDGAFHVDEEAGEGQVAGATKMSRASVTVTDSDIRCTGRVPLRNGEHKVCGRLLAKLAGRPWEIVCSRCKQANRSPA